MYVIDLTGKVTIVTGGAQGIGQAIAQALLDCGAEVAVVDRGQEAPAWLHEHKKATYIRADVTDSQQVEDMVDQIQKHFGQLDILVNNAGVSTMDYVVDIKEEDWDR